MDVQTAYRCFVAVALALNRLTSEIVNYHRIRLGYHSDCCSEVLSRILEDIIIGVVSLISDDSMRDIQRHQMFERTCKLLFEFYVIVKIDNF